MGLFFFFFLGTQLWRIKKNWYQDKECSFSAIKALKFLFLSDDDPRAIFPNGRNKLTKWSQTFLAGHRVTLFYIFVSYLNAQLYSKDFKIKIVSTRTTRTIPWSALRSKQKKESLDLLPRCLSMQLGMRANDRCSYRSNKTADSVYTPLRLAPN